MAEIVLAGGKGTLSLHAGGTLHLIWVPGSILEAEDVTESVLAMEAFSAGRKLPLLIEIIDVNLTVEACNHYRDTWFVSSVAMVGTTYIDRVVAAWVLRGQHSLQKFFTSRPAAVEWLEDLSAPDIVHQVPA
ncbi:hypothetical protein [Arthrobacter sp. ISL-72]|uniref:DUF7793 family protein n=1 Tax=Arthrobacter sp. ISL-72 TaxID=2819114 RepID=UPI001BEB6C17|nr:hypothetical protein [Arthrobacter sp. ISL-72]MBT2597210.1 hypothetical protein [Arthrobacter sp. ISL-72]